MLIYVADDPNETKDLYDEDPENVVKALFLKLTEEKNKSVQNVFVASLGVVPETSVFIDRYNVFIPKANYCVPTTDFPLKPQKAKCNIKLPRSIVKGSKDTCKK